MNIPLLRQIQAQIIQHPEHFDMRQWACGTTACIGGWALRLCGEQIRFLDNDVDERARVLLDLTRLQANRLFYQCPWPKKFQMTDCHRTKEAAKKAVARIDWFIQTEGKE